jgi:glycosyltransferase involved in cell wall biosynthesis
MVRHALERFMEGRDPTHFSWKEKLELGVEGILTGQVFELLKPANASLWKALADEGVDESLQDAVTRRTGTLNSPEDRAFQIANIIAGRLAFRFVRSFIEQSRQGNLMQAIQDVAVLFPVLAPLAPYFLELKREAPNRVWLQKLSRSAHGRDVTPLVERKVAWLTDTLEDVNGVSKTICKLASAGSDAGFSVTVLSCRSDSRLEGVPLKNFEPIGEFALPEYELQKLSFPPVLEIVEYIQRERFTEIILSTPGPVGLVGLLAARLLGIPVKGIYHTDFPRYVRILTDDSDLESLAWTFMHWFYTGLDSLYVNSEPYREAWINRGAAPHRVRILPRGMDVQLFNPSRRRPDFWKKRGAKDGQVVLLYVGRVSREKDLDLLVPVMAALRDLSALLAIVGDGPYQSELKRVMPDAIFTGYLLGEELAEAYASADIFVFPSTTDTYGNVVVEALASGLPCVVSSEGGPSGLVQHGRTGYVTKGRDVGGIAGRLRHLVENTSLRKTMSENAVLELLKSDWKSAAACFFLDESSPMNSSKDQKSGTWT